MASRQRAQTRRLFPEKNVFYPGFANLASLAMRRLHRKSREAGTVCGCYHAWVGSSRPITSGRSAWEKYGDTLIVLQLYPAMAWLAASA